ncbi:MAG: Cys-tRNA(Pro) deacylase [Pyrinomonadaceae bacterium]
MTDYPVTPAVRMLREKNIAFEPRLYDYEERGGTRHSAESLGVDEHAVVKTLVMQTDAKKPLVVLMHGDREVSTKNLARALNVKSVSPCDPATAQKHTGYAVGGTSPFGTHARMTTYVERTIFELPKIYINGGKRGFLVEIEPQALRILSPLEEVEVAIEKAA